MCVFFLSRLFRLFFVVIGFLTDEEPTGENPSSVSEPGARDTKFQLPVSIHFFKTFFERGAAKPSGVRFKD